MVGKGKGKANFVNIASKKRTKHILYGDKTGGGHLCLELETLKTGVRKE